MSTEIHEQYPGGPFPGHTVKFREDPLTALMKEIGTELIDNRICSRTVDIQARFNWKIGGGIKEDWHEFREYSCIAF